MEKLSLSIVSKLSTLQKRLESVLDNDFENINHREIEETRQNFEASRDPGLVRGLSQALPDDHIDRAVVMFSRLAMCFESGVLLENNDGQWKAQAYFNKGVTELFKSANKTVLPMPDSACLTVLKAKSQPILQKLHLERLDPENKNQALMIKVTHDYAFVLFSTLPDIWLKDHAENIRMALVNGFAD
ncbi:hypothetical protein D3C87_1357130 [compost metagenome]